MRKGALAFLAYGVITIVLTYPLVLHISTVLPNDAGDPSLNTWILWWNTQTMPFSSAWWNAPAFYPAEGVLSFSENLLGLSLISTPLSVARGRTADGVQHRVPAHVPAERDRRVICWCTS